jgi:hypothetical protein
VHPRTLAQAAQLVSDTEDRRRDAGRQVGVRHLGGPARSFSCEGAVRNTCPGERLRLAPAFRGKPRRYVVLGAASFDDQVDGVVGRPDPDQVAVRVDDGTDLR